MKLVTLFRSKSLGALRELEQMGISGLAAAAWMRTVEEVTSRTPQPDLVWSGPEVPGLHARDTRRVYEELLSSAERSVWASTFAFWDGPKAFKVLAKRMDEIPELRVVLLLNIQRTWGDTTAADHLVRKFADRFWQADWPGSSRPRVFFDLPVPPARGPRGSTPCQGRRGRRRGRLCHLRESDRSSLGPQHRSWRSRQRSRTRAQRIESLPSSDRQGLAETVANGVRTGRAWATSVRLMASRTDDHRDEVAPFSWHHASVRHNAAYVQG